MIDIFEIDSDDDDDHWNLLIACSATVTIAVITLAEHSERARLHRTSLSTLVRSATGLNEFLTGLSVRLSGFR